jgi:hypothetical protein
MSRKAHPGNKPLEKATAQKRLGMINYMSAIVCEAVCRIRNSSSYLEIYLPKDRYFISSRAF